MILESAEMLGVKIKSIFLQYGFSEVELASNYKYLSNKNQIFQNASFILADLDNQNFNAVQFIQGLKMNPETKAIPIIFMSGSPDFQKIKMAMVAGGTDFILKPFETETLIKKATKAYYGDEKKINTYKKFHTGEIFDEVQITLPWTKGFEIGVPQIDEEHKKIIENYNQLYLVMKENKGQEYYKKMLDFLVEYVDVHFSNEEELQSRISFDNYVAHKEMHNMFRIQLKDMQLRYEKEGICNRDLISMCLFVKDWLLHHILLEDKKIAEFILKNDINKSIS